MAHRVLETRETRVVPVIDLAFVVYHCEELVVVQSFWAWIAIPVPGGSKHLIGGCRFHRKLLTCRCHLRPLSCTMPCLLRLAHARACRSCTSPIHVVRSAAPRRVISKTIFESLYIGRNANLELDGQYRGKPLDRESFVGLLRDLATFLTGPVFDCNVLGLRKPARTAPS